MGMTSLAQNFFLALMRAIWPISRPRSGRDCKWNGRPQDPGCRTEPGAPLVEGEERRGPSTAQPNHLTGSEMGRKNWVASVGMTVGGDLPTHARTSYPPPAHHLPTHGKRREVPPLRNPTISREVRWEEKVGLLRSG